MAKVKIQGHASGTGVLTVTAPNTSTDRTLTLPDGTGTLALTTDDDDKLPLTGGTLTNTLTVQNNVSSNTDPSLILSGSSNASQDSYMQMGAMFTSNPVAIGLDNSSNLFKIARNSSGNISSGEHLVINSSGVVSVPNGIELGSGIDATAANTLDDYEEGSWNPAYTAHQGSIGSTDYGEWEGYYTKIGRLVTCQFKITLSNKGSWTGEVRLTGLPFSVQVTLPAVGSVRLANVNVPNDASNHDVYVTAGVTYFRIYYTQDNATSSFVLADQVQNTSVFAGTISYITVA